MAAPSTLPTPHLTVVPLGGVGEIGKNMWALEYQEQILVLDAGLMFPSEDMPGIEFILPDITYLVERRKQVVGLCLSHGHEDHIGAVPYFIDQIPVPVYGTTLTLGLVESKLKEFKLLDTIRMVPVKARQVLQIGPFSVQFLRMTHSIPDGAAIAIETPVGTVIYSGDFKMDQTPVDGEVSDLYKLAEYGEKGVLMLLSDSTNAEKPGMTPSERKVGPALYETMQQAPGHVIVTTFASNIHRIQQTIDAAQDSGRKVALVGKSMERVVRKATELGYMDYPPEALIPATQLNQHEPHQIVILTTGSQGEPTSGLRRMADGRHKHVNVNEGDTVVVSAIPIPGNERAIASIIDQLFVKGAHVIYQAAAGMHVSGHGNQEDLKLMLNLTRPKFFIPIHGERRHQVHHANLAMDLGIPPEQIFVLRNGDQVAFHPGGASIARQIKSGVVLIDRRSAMVGTQGHIADDTLQDRQSMVRDGIVFVTATVDPSLQVVAGPQFVARGFTWPEDQGDLDRRAAAYVLTTLATLRAENAGATHHDVQATMAKAMGKFLYDQTRRRPIIESLVQELEHPEYIGEVPEEPYLYREPG